ncbi:MAG: GNAT family N-acetyltransferase [Acholeplasma sp.]|nr:GNAT family N-acetyltransferase [Acholeplasma sp.]
MDYITEDHQIYVCDDGTKIAEVTFPLVSEGLVDINHVEVNPDYRGQGIANKLMLLCVEAIEGLGYKAIISCPYAIKFFNENDNYKHLLK